MVNPWNDVFPLAATCQPSSHPTRRRLPEAPQKNRSWSQPVAGLVFEQAGVLYDDTAWRRWLLQQLVRIGLTTLYRPFFQVFDRDFLPDVHCGRREYWDAQHAFLIDAGLTVGQVNEVETAGRSRWRQFEAETRLLPGVAATLTRLAARNVPLAVVANSPYSADDLQRRLGQMGLAGRFAAVISSRDLGCCKPAAPCYQAALDALHLGPSDVAYVGQDADELRGAAAIGMPTVGFGDGVSASADIVLDRFDQLLTAVPLRAQSTFTVQAAA